MATFANRIHQLRINFYIWLLRLISRTVEKNWFQQAVLKPVIRVTLVWAIWALLFDRLPENIASNPKIAAMVSDYRTKMNARVNELGRGGEEDRANAKTMTWGFAGACTILLTAIVTAHVFTISVLVAAACFSISLPAFSILGFSYLLQTDPKKMPPKVKDVLAINALIWLAQLIFCVGLAAYLWSYHWAISLAFVAGCYWAWKYLHRFVANHNSSQPLKAANNQPNVEAQKTDDGASQIIAEG